MRVPAGLVSLSGVALGLVVLSTGFPFTAAPLDGAGGHVGGVDRIVLLCAAGVSLLSPARRAGLWALVATAGAGAVLLAIVPSALGAAPPAAGFWLCLAGLAVIALQTVRRLAQIDGGPAGIAAAVLLGVWILYFWQVLAAAFAVPKVLLPTPWLIAESLASGVAILSQDFVQTVLKSVVSGWLLGCASGFLVGIAIDRVPFLQRGLLPVAALTSAIPLVGIAPIAVMWFGFDWPSKAAVVVLMTFFPMLIATLAGLKAASRQQIELMHSYAAGYLQTLLALRLPTALPFLFGALKVNAALALIGAIVAEFFGSPTSGLGFRISTEAAHMNMALVWAAIVVAAATGSLNYALLSGLERRVAFWHPSVRES